MFLRFISLEFKSFIRSASVGKSIALKILLGFLAVYFLTAFLFLGVALYPISKELNPNQDPLTTVNNFVLLWLVIELFYRFFLQSLPVLNIKPLLVVPIPRSKVIHFVLLKSLLSFYNILPLLLIVPFGIFYAVKEKISVWNIIPWMVSVYVLTLCVNYTNFILKKRFADNLKRLLPFLALGLLLFGLEYFEVFRITVAFGKLLGLLIDYPILMGLPFLILFALYYWNFSNLRAKFYLDESIQTKSKEVSTVDYNWVRRFGKMAPFLQLDLKLIWRNKRPKTTVWMSLFFLLYGLIFYPNPTYQSMPAFFVFVGIFVTGIFMVNFGQFIPSWDSAYFSMMMSQNIPLKEYLNSKAGLMTFSVVVLAILSVPYAFFGLNILALNLACALYNIGVNVPILMYSGSFNKKRIDLDKSPFMNYQGTGAAQWIVGFPLLLIPILIWYLAYYFFSYETGVAVLAILGLVGILLRNYLMQKIALQYAKRKYDILSGYKQQES
jgi:hypothetical protein